MATITGNLAGETVARQTADTNLQNQVDTLTAAVGTGGTVDQRIQAEATTRANADTALSNRITPLEQAVGTGGSIDTRISNAKSEIIGNATSACDTLGEAEVKINTNTTAISNEATARTTADEQLRQLYENLTQSDIVVGPRPSSGQLTNVIYREPDQSNIPPQNYSDYMWYNNGWVLMATYDNAIDDVPTPSSNNLVKSGGVANALIPILSIDPSMDYVNYLIKDIGIDENGQKNSNNTRSIIIVKLAENSSTITINTDVPLKTGNFYTGFPDIINGSNFISPRINPVHVTETIIASAKYYIVMLDTSNRYPTYIRFSQEGNYASQAELLAVENNIGKVNVVTLMNRDCNIPATSYRNFYNIIPLTEDNVATILITGYSGVIKAVRADYGTISELPFTNNVPFQMSLTTECAMFSFYTNGNIPAPSQINFHVKAVYNDLSGRVAYLEELSDITKETADNFYKTDLIDVNGTITSGSFRYNGDVPSAKRPTNKTYGEIAFASSTNNLYLKFYGSSYSDIGYASVHLTSELKRVWIPANAAVFSVLTENNTPAVADINFELNISYFSTDVLTAEECDNRLGDYENWSENNRYLPVLYNLNRNSINTTYNQPYGENPSDTSTFRQLVLQIITDIHNEEVAAKSFLEFNKKYSGIIDNNKPLIDDMVGLGDYVNGGLEETLTIANFEGWHDILKAIGNHDSYENWRQHGSSIIVSEQVCYDTFMDGYIENWGVVYQSGKTYFYKDYDAQRVRLVFLDYMHWDEENDVDGQKAWLQNILYADPVNSALVKEYHVVIARHYICKSENSGSPVPLSDCSFVSLDRHSFDTEEITTECDIVNEFITRGGTFIAWLVGHRHFNWTGVYENYPYQIIIHQPCSAAFTYGRESSFPKNTDYINQFNLISFDTMYKRIKVYRVGAVYDRNMQHSESMILSYDRNNFGLVRCF